MQKATSGELSPQKRSLLILITIFLLVWFVLPNLFPQTAPFIHFATLPARQVGILIHEMGHGIGAVLTGGIFSYLQLMPLQGGIAYTAGGLSLAVLLLGLWGPTLFGVGLLLASAKHYNPRTLLVALLIFFLLSLYFMLTPLFLPSHRLPQNVYFDLTQFIALLVPLSCIAVILRSLHWRESSQHLLIQISGIFCCFSGYSDTHYIFWYEPLAPGLYSDTRQVAGTIFLVGAANVPYSLFFIVACGISLVNFGFLGWGVWKIFKSDP
jgi:hypothetical protein